MIDYDKSKVREALTSQQIFDLLIEFGGDPTWTTFGIVSATICHNKPGEGSKKLYYYFNTGLFRCYTGCDSSFDIFELVVKVFKIQQNQEFDLNDAVRWVAMHFGILNYIDSSISKNEMEDWKILANYKRIQELQPKEQKVFDLKAYNTTILDRMNYHLRLRPWLDEGISQEVLEQAHIGFYPGGDQITIPHYDVDGHFIGLRGRTLCQKEGELFGKYRPIRINQKLYNHPLGMNLYGLNWSKDAIGAIKKAIVFEGEKSFLLYATYFGWENNISVACCGSSLSNYQIELLKKAGAEEVIIAFDRQFKEIGDDEFKHLKRNLIHLGNKYKNDIMVSCIFDKNMITGYKDSPIDCGKEKFLQLFKERIIL